MPTRTQAPLKPGGVRGRLITALPIADLRQARGGAWNAKPSLRKSSITSFQGDTVLKVVYEKGSGTSGHSKSSGKSGGWAISAKPRGIPGTALVLAFDVYFERGWNWSKGGKFGGFKIGQGVASGYRWSETAATHRIMWQRDGGAIAYIYPPAKLPQEDPRMRPTGKGSGHGAGFFKELFPAGTLKIGQWNHLELGVRLNTFSGSNPNPDGVATVTVNGVTGTLRNVRWRRSANLLISAIDFNTFFGGPDPAVVDSVCYMKGFALHEMAG